MKSLSIIGYYDVFKGSQPCLPTGSEALQLDTLGAQGAEETLGHGVIVGITFAAYADDHTARGQEGEIIICRVLATAVGMVDQDPFGHALSEGHAQRRFNQRFIAELTHRHAMTRCEKVSNKAATYSQPSSVQSPRMSPTYLWLGALALKSRVSRFGATGR